MVLEALSSRARFICTTVVQIGVAVLVAMRFASYTLAFDGHVGRSRVLIHTTKVTDVLSVGCTYLGSRADMRYVRMWYIIRHTKTKIIARVHTCTRHTAHGTRADFFFGMYQLETRLARITILSFVRSISLRRTRDRRPGAKH